ncbi:amidohydrolase family protein [Salipiger sp.]|uniref:amidohydrolase family protein n=1 Tax=Salipiger sp. TaxID=2078585 RepID=UPI003A985695
MSHDTKPRLTVPAGACDCHMHIYDDRFPPSDRAYLFPRNFLVDDYLAMRARLGIDRTVIVQPVTYGFDNRCTLEAVARIGDSARCIVTVPTDATDETLADLRGRGARGFRFHQMRGGVLAWEDLPVMADRIRGSDWHVQVQLDGMELPEREEAIAALPCTVVLDHMGRFSGEVDLDHPAVRALLRLAARDNVFVKLSGASYVSRQGAPGYGDLYPLARALVGVSDRLVWGSDWPHPTETDETRPDDARLLDLLGDWDLTPAQVKAVLCATPARLYGFSPVD